MFFRTRQIINKIVLLGMLLAALVVMLYDYQVKEVNGTHFLIQKQTMELRTDQFAMALWNPDKDDNRERDLLIHAWENHDIYYFFIPNSWKKDTTYILHNSDNELWIDEQTIGNGDLFNLEEGSHIVRQTSGEEYVLEVLYSSDIPALFLEADSDGVERIEESKEEECKASYLLMDDTGAFCGDGGIETLSCRGNASFTEHPKKSYTLKLETEADWLGFGASKKWLLISNYYDETLMRNMIVDTMARESGISYMPDRTYTDVYINGEYAGNYLLSEKVEISSERIEIADLEEENKNLNADMDFDTIQSVEQEGDMIKNLKWTPLDRIPEDISGGYLLQLETDIRYTEELSGFTTIRDQQVILSSPKYADYEQVYYIAKLYQNFEDAIFAKNGIHPQTKKHYSEYMDMDSFVKYYLIDEITKQLDASKTSFYMYKPENEEKLYAGPLWDYDKSLGCGYEAFGISLADPKDMYASVRKSDSDVWYALYQQNDFKEKVQNVYQRSMREISVNIAEEWIPETKEKIEASAIMNLIRWDLKEEQTIISERETYFTNEVEEMKTFLEQRLLFLNQEWEMSEDE